MRTHSRSIALAASILFAACAPKAEAPAEKKGDDPAAVRAAIEKTNANFLASIQKGDAVAGTAQYADDAIVMMPNEKAWRGHEAITKGMTGFISQFAITAGQATTADVIVSGDYAIETGAAIWTLTPKKGKAMTDTVKYVTVWKKQADASWKIIRDINNSDRSAGP